MTAEKAKKKKKAKDLRTPEEKWDLLMTRLHLHQGCWAIQTEDEVYVFPQYITKEEAIKVLRIAHDYNHTKLN